MAFHLTFFSKIKIPIHDIAPLLLPSDVSSGYEAVLKDLPALTRKLQKVLRKIPNKLRQRDMDKIEYDYS